MLSTSAKFPRSVELLDSERFLYEEHCTHGFPLGPSCLSFDPYRRVMFIGTNSGELKMVGHPGVELTGFHDDLNKINQILPFASEPSLITVCSNNMMHKWNLVDMDGAPSLVRQRSYKFQGGLAKTITVCCLPPYCDCLFVGTLGGITYPMETDFEGMSPEVLSWSRARACLGYKGKDVPGEVKALEINPTDIKELLIAYEHNYLELWDAMTWKPKKIFGPFTANECGDIQTVSWHSSGKQFVTGHLDGSVATWSVGEDMPLTCKTFHENERCQEIKKILWPSDSMMVMSGGAPIDQVDGDCITIVESGEVITLQVTSPARGIHVVEDSQSDMDSGIVNAGAECDNSSSTVRKVLVLLLEQEILFVDLRFPELPLIQPPYLSSIHNSPVKCMELPTNVRKDIWQLLAKVGKVQQETVFRTPSKSWPIDGGSPKQANMDNRDLLITGHEDGTVKFWDIRGVSSHLVYSLNCAQFFDSLDSSNLQSDNPDEQLPQCRHISFWDPRSDDEQLMITSILFSNEHILIGFQGGVSILFQMNNQSSHINIPLIRVSIMRDDPRQRGRNWQTPLDMRSEVESEPGYHPLYGFSFFPNVAITTSAIAKTQGLVAIGCLYGFAVIDYLKKTPIHVQSTYDQQAAPEPSMSRMQSIRRSFRQSLKRLNVARSMRGMQSTQRSVRPNLVRSGSSRPSVSRRYTDGGGPLSSSAAAAPVAVAVRRDSVRSIAFVAPSHVSGHGSVPSVIVGTNTGNVIALSIELPSPKHRETRTPIVMPIERDFNPKKSNLATLFAGVIDGHSYLLDINDKGSFHPHGSQFIVVVTEDSVKVHGLPNMKKKFRVKVKQTDEDEFHIVSAHFIRVAGQSNILLMDSEGFITIYSLPELKLVYRENCVDSTDAIGQRSFRCTQNGLVVYQRSPSEFTHGSITEECRVDMLFSWVSEEGRDQRRMGPGGGAGHGPQLQPLPATPKRLLDSSSHHSPIREHEVEVDYAPQGGEDHHGNASLSAVGSPASPQAFQERAL